MRGVRWFLSSDRAARNEEKMVVGAPPPPPIVLDVEACYAWHYVACAAMILCGGALSLVLAAAVYVLLVSGDSVLAQRWSQKRYMRLYEKAL